MKKRLRFSASTIMLIFALSVPSYAWSSVGHMAVAYVAYQNLTPQVRSRVDELVSLNPRFNLWLKMIPAGTSEARKRLMLFMISSTWADQIKNDGLHHSDGTHGGNRPPDDGTADRNTGYEDMALHKYWHFIDLPFSRDGTPLQDPPVPNAETQIAAFRAVLASDSPDPLKSYDLVWLVHLIGDVHQPLHCTARFTKTDQDGDDGGNGVKVCSPGCGSSLHSFWDGLFGTSPKPAIAITVGKSLPAAPANLADNLDAAEWIAESFRAAKSTVYRNPIKNGAGPFTITSKYRNAAMMKGRERVALGGARLAKILNDELK
jgi:S1/P1 Nuclease